MPSKALSPVTQMLASSALVAIRSSDAKSSPWMMEKVQSTDELLLPTLLPTPPAPVRPPAPPAPPAEAEPLTEDEDPAAVTWLITSDVWTHRTSRMVQMGTGWKKKAK